MAYQKIVTKANLDLFKKYPFGSQEKTADPLIIVKFFCPWNQWTWYATEAETQEDGDIMFFGLVRGHEVELGYFMLSELESVKHRSGLKIEREMHSVGMLMSQARAECGSQFKF